MLDIEQIFNDIKFSGNGAIIVAVSGGGDSLALLFLLADYLTKHHQKDRLKAVTIDHALRAESANEAAYVAKLCAQYGIYHQTLTWDYGEQKPQMGVQEKARFGRYHLLAQAAQELHADYICIAHNMEDRAETYYMRRERVMVADFKGHFGRLAKRGLASMAKHALLFGRFVLLRPLLAIKREELRIYLQSKGIKWIDDPSNEDRHYERVRIRQDRSMLEKEKAIYAADKAALERKQLNKLAVQWGQKLALKRDGKGFYCSLQPWQARQHQTDLDDNALYLLLSYMAAMISGKNYLDNNDKRLQDFIAKLAHWHKGDAPIRISFSGSVVEKRQQILTMQPEQRQNTKTTILQHNKGSEIVADKMSLKGNTQRLGPFSFITPSWDFSIYQFFKEREVQ